MKHATDEGGGKFETFANNFNENGIVLWTARWISLHFNFYCRLSRTTNCVVEPGITRHLDFLLANKQQQQQQQHENFSNVIE